MSPIKSIQISNLPNQYNNRTNNIFNWNNESFEIKRLNKIDYISLYLNKNGKICGKDNYGNNLYFQNGEDCPINKIYFSDNNENLAGYKKIELNNGRYLYYTNESIEDKIIIDIRKSYNSKIPINPGLDDLNNFPFYDEIDNIGRNSFLYSINYLGINISSVTEEKLEDFKHKMEVYESCAKGKLASFCLLNIFIFLAFIVFILFIANCEEIQGKVIDILKIIFIVCVGVVYLLYIIFILVCLGIHVQYITNFMNKINSDFEREKNDFKWNLIIFLYEIIFIIIPILIIFLGKYFKCTKNEENVVIPFQTDNNNEINNKNIEKIKELEIKISEKNKDIENLNKKIDKLQNNQNEVMILKTSVIEDEHLMIINFECVFDHSYDYSFQCTNKQIFADLENQLHKKFPNLKDFDIYYLYSGGKITKYYETLEELGIKDREKILFDKIED